MVARQMRRVGFNPYNGEFKKIYRKAKPYDIERWQGGHRSGARNDDHRTPDRRRNGTQYENRRRGVPRRQDQGDLLLHRRRARGFPRANQGLRRTVSHPHRNETDRRPPGSGTHRRHRSLRPRTVLRIVDLEFLECDDQLGPYAGDLPQPPKLAGQCSKLKCCLAYEYDTYVDARKEFPVCGNRSRLSTANITWSKPTSWPVPCPSAAARIR